MDSIPEGKTEGKTEEKKISKEVSNVLSNLKLQHKIISPDNKEEYNNFYEIMMGMFSVDENGNKITPKYSYEEGIKKIFN